MPRSSVSRALWKKKSPKSARLAEIGAPPTCRCFSSRCQPRGRTRSVAVFSASAYFFPSGEVKVSLRRTASIKLTWPVTTLLQVGESESSKSDMKTSAPELSALIIILRSTGPVISTWRFCRSAGVGATFHFPARTCAVSGRNSNCAPAASER